MMMMKRQQVDSKSDHAAPAAVFRHALGMRPRVSGSDRAAVLSFNVRP